MRNIDKAYIEENNVINKYVNGKLSAEESAEFEAYFIDKPELLEQIELELVLKENIPLVVSHSKKPSILSLWFGTWPKVIFAMSISVFAGVLVSNVIVNHEAKFLQGETHIAYIESFRTTNNNVDVNTIHINNRVKQLVLVYTPVYPQEKRFKIIVIASKTKKVIFESTDMRKNNDDELVIALPTSLLQKGSYDLVVTALSADVHSNKKDEVQLNIN